MKITSDRLSADPPEGNSAIEVPGKLNLVVARVLAGGLAVALVLLLTGSVMVIAGRGPSPAGATDVADIPRALLAREPSGFLNLGLLVLLVTPVARVVALALGFARRRSWRFCGASVLVLSLLALSAYLGLRGH